MIVSAYDMRLSDLVVQIYKLLFPDFLQLLLLELRLLGISRYSWTETNTSFW